MLCKTDQLELQREWRHLNAVQSLFADPENYTIGSLGSSIANSAANFDSIWNIADNSGFGISGLVKRWTIKPLPGEQACSRRRWVAHDELEDFDEDVRKCTI